MLALSALERSEGALPDFTLSRAATSASASQMYVRGIAGAEESISALPPRSVHTAGPGAACATEKTHNDHESRT